MIEIQHLNKSFDRQKVLNDISLSFKPGQSVALIGPNGSGKTTLIKNILGMVRPESGDILFKGTSILGTSEYRRTIGYMPQIQRFPEHMRVRQLFSLMQDLRKDVRDEEYDRTLYRNFDVPSMSGKKLGQLSGGMKQKVSAALAFLFDPEVLILDEPTAGLDPVSNEILKDQLRLSLEQGKLVLITSHILSDLDEITTDVAYLMDGNLTFYRTLEDLKKETSEDRLNRMIAKVLKSENSYV